MTTPPADPTNRFVLYDQRVPADHTPVPDGPAIAVIRQEWSGSAGTLCGDILLSEQAWHLLVDLADYQPQVVKRARMVELLYKSAGGRIAIRPTREGTPRTTFGVIPAYSTLPGRRDAWPMKIRCREFLDHWAIPEVPLHRPAPASVETGLLTFSWTRS